MHPYIMAIMTVYQHGQVSIRVRKLPLIADGSQVLDVEQVIVSIG